MNGIKIKVNGNKRKKSGGSQRNIPKKTRLTTADTVVDNLSNDAYNNAPVY